MNLSRLALVWHMDGAVPLPAGQSVAEALDRLDPLFHQPGTSHERAGDQLAFRKKGQAAQDPMAVFDAGTLDVVGGEGAHVRYRLRSRFLLFCCLLPLFFVAMGQLTLLLDKPLPEPTKEEAAKAKAKEVEAVKPLHPIDQLLGAPAPEKPGKDKKNEAKERKKPSATTAYVLAGIFAFLYLFGRWNEERKLRALLGRQLAG